MKVILSVLAFALISCSSSQGHNTKIAFDENTKAISDLHSATIKGFTGLLKIEDKNDHLKVEIEVNGLTPFSHHRLHIHEQGICEGPFYKSSGDHFDPYKRSHGKPDSKLRHIGDLGNIEVDGKGQGKKIVIWPKEKSNDLNLVIAKSVLLHASADDLKTQPSGNSGERIACGLIKPVN